MNETATQTDTAGVMAPPPLIYLAAILVGYGLARILPEPAWVLSLPMISGAILIAAGAGLLAWGFLSLRRAHTAVNPYEPTTVLVTHGPYRFSRNPLYVALTVVHVGIGVWLQSIWVVTTALPAVLVVHYGVVLREERYLLRKFGAAYRSYHSQVRRWL